MRPFEAAWDLLKELQSAQQDLPDMSEEEMRHFQNMQMMRERYTPRGNTLNIPNLHPGAKPPPFFGGFPSLGNTDIYETRPDLQIADLHHQADFSRNPGDARRFREQAAEIEANLAPVAVENPQASVPVDSNQGIDMDEMERFLAEAYRRSIAPLSYRRKVMPFSDEEMSRQLADIKRFRNRRGMQ